MSSYVKKVVDRFAALAAPLAILFALGQVAQSVVFASTPVTGCVQAQLELLVATESAVVNKLSIGKLADEIATRRSRVPEFRFIAEEAKRRGLRVWLFGGTAAGYTHYVKWDVLRELGDTRFQANRFDYDYTNIFRSTQDLDIVVDGTVEQAKGLEQALKSKYPHFMGSKATPWEVRSLTEDTNGKGGILGDFGFMNQHTDSHSTGMVELTEPPKGESVVRDVRDWKNTTGAQFLKDVHSGELTIYYSPTHAQTPRAKEGKNPSIFFVTRALTKAFQYDLKLRDDQLQLFKKVIQEFNANSDLANSDAARWMEKNGKKLYEHSVDLETSRRVLDELGLREKLLQIKNNPSEKGSLSWWMNKEPLESKPVGQGTGRTAAELGITVVSHETSDFLAYESITRSHTGKPNVFISRKNAADEAAVHGDRFYTAKGNKGARQTGITIRSTVDPNAREGWDFDLAEIIHTPNGKIADGTQVNFQNRNAFTIIPESIDMTVSGYFRFLVEGKTISEDDKALLWKLKRKIDHTIISGQIPASEMEEVRAIILEQLKRHVSKRSGIIKKWLLKFKNDAQKLDVVLQEWLRLEGARLKIPQQEIEQIFKALNTKTYEIDPAVLVNFLTDISRNTAIEEYVTKTWLPSLINLKTVKTDIGDRALENCLLSGNPSLREFGARALRERQQQTPYLSALKSVVAQNRDVVSWLKLEAKTPEQIEEKAAYLALHPERRKDLTEVTLRSIEPALRKVSNIQVFEKRAGGMLPADLKAESFQFVQFNFPEGGKHLRLGSRVKKDLHEVTLTKPFQMQVTPVTQQQWLIVMGHNPSTFTYSGNRPVETVSWTDVQKFIDNLNALDPEYTYRLPTEAEWEYAAGRDPDDFSLYGSESGIEVVSLKPNEYGLHDMRGNVGEWVQDWYADYPTGNVVDPAGPSSGFYRVVRGGGAVLSETKDMRAASRRVWEPIYGSASIGFRLVRQRIKN